MSYTQNLPAHIKFIQITDADHFFYQLKSDYQNHLLKSSRNVAQIVDKIFDEFKLTEDYDFGLEFSNCYFKSEVFFQEGRYKGSISFKNCYFDHGFNILELCKFDDLFEIVNGSLKQQLLIRGGEFQEVRLSFSECPYLKISGGNFKELNIGYYGNSKIGKLNIDASRINGLINIGGSNNCVDDINLSHTSTDLSISIADIQLNRILIYRYRNNKSFKISNVKPVNSPNQSELTIFESYMGKSEFYSSDLSAFSSININHSNLLDCSFVNITWPNTINSFKGTMIHKDESEKLIEQQVVEFDSVSWFKRILLRRAFIRQGINNQIIAYFRDSKEVYRQLKFVHSKQGDVISEQRFHSLEMQAFDKSITSWRNFSTKLIVNFSHWFSDFGTSISRPVLGLLGGHLILLNLLIFKGGIPGIELSLTNASWEGFWEGFTWYFKLINPLRKYDDFQFINGGIIIIDLSMRIWASYMIYNFVRASRRFIKC